ncbi:HPr kinase/phosphorylase [Parasphingorhabdus litoris]|uniref:HPr kinase/phosphorylase n=1 Tax=Parasphingorhabdus litoris TaxID=394733 RepID=A0ABN1AU33_9SPHN|nr:HPr kinase/phosphatase C-terminal domain-containing protein [Parasphingorhabdus litoris]
MTHSNPGETRHASCVAIQAAGIMLSGPSGAGKSDLALRLIDRGATLISDDYVELHDDGNQIRLNAPAKIAGKIEIRSLGIFDCKHVSNIPLRLQVILKSKTERFPLDNQLETIMTMAIPTITINPAEASAPIKVEKALQRLLQETQDD